MRTRQLLIMVLVGSVACGSTPPPPPAIDATLLDGPSRARAVDVATLVDEAADARLADVLAEAGFVGGEERTWIDRRSDVWRTVVRALRFGSDEDALSYLAWLDANVASLIGPSVPTGGDGTIAYEHHPSDCCPNKDGPQALAAAADGDLVWVVTVAGPAADASRAAEVLPLPERN